MKWKTFVDGLIPENKHQKTALIEKMAAFPNAPDLIWYPGSGADLVPLLLDVPNNPTGRRIYRVDQKPDKTPLLFWMNDYGESFRNFPEDELLGKNFIPNYGNLWESYMASVDIGANAERYRSDRNVSITLFTATVKNQLEGAHARKETGDEYLVCFSSCESESLFEKVISFYCLQLFMVILVGHSDFSKKRNGLDHYLDLPARISEMKDQVGEVVFWCVDRYGQKDSKPIATSLKDYEYIGGPLNWGWSPARLYAKPGTDYLREKRHFRDVKSWRK